MLNKLKKRIYIESLHEELDRLLDLREKQRNELLKAIEDSKSIPHIDCSVDIEILQKRLDKTFMQVSIVTDMITEQELK